MTPDNMMDSSEPGIPPGLLVQGSRVVFGNFIIPTLKEKLRVGMKNYTPPNNSNTLSDGYTPKERAGQQEIQKNMRTVALMYWKEASIETIMADYKKPNGIIYSFDEMVHFEPNLMERLFTLIGEKNPKIKERYDNTRLVMDMPNVQGRKWIQLFNFGDLMTHLVLDVYTLDINDNWLRDRYKLESNGSATYFESLSQEDIAKEYVPEITTPVDIYDPQHPEKGLQGQVKGEVEKIIARLKIKK